MRVRWGLLALAAVGCGLPSVAEFAGGSPTGAPVADSGLDAAPSPTGTATSTPETDGGEGGAGGVEACPPGALFCDDFESAPFDARWDQQVLELGGSVAGGAGRVGKGIIANVPQRSGDVRPVGYLQRKLPVAGLAALTVSLDVKMSAVEGIGVVDLDFLRCSPPFYRVGVRIAPYNGGFMMHWYGEPTAGHGEIGGDVPITTRKLVREVWSRMTFSLFSSDAGPIRGKLLIDGITAFDGALPDATDYAAGDVRVVAGLGQTENAGAAVTLATDHFVVTSP